MRHDLAFIQRIAEQFFNQRHITERLNHIENRNVTGWEIWLQIEMSVFIDNHIEIAQWWREYPYNIDRRSAPHRKNMIIDFVLRKKNAALNKFIALEIKQNSKVSQCIRGMMEDIHKVRLVRNSENDLRSMWCLGIHAAVPEEDAYACIDEYAHKLRVDLSKSYRISKKIEGTKLSYTIF